MADPEQIYQEVLSEEQSKGVSAAVAEGRAKAARARAEAGSPHPKEPKWWPGAQPHLESGDGAAPAAEPEAAEPEVEAEAEPAAEVAEEPAAEAAEPEAEAEPAAEAAEEPAAEAPAAAPVAAEPAPAVPQEQAASAETAAPAAVAAAAPEQKSSGVIHGTAAGTRLRPEDAVTTDAQFQGQQAMYDRRKLIDELVGTGVPAVSAAATGERRSPALAFLYLLIPIMAIAFLLAQDDAGGGDGVPPVNGGPQGITLVAQNVQFDTDQLTLPAGEATVTLDNQDSVPHDFAIYEDDSASEDLFLGAEVAGGSSIDYEILGLEAGEYFFQCNLHPAAMTGTVTVE